MLWPHLRNVDTVGLCHPLLVKISLGKFSSFFILFLFPFPPSPACLFLSVCLINMESVRSLPVYSHQSHLENLEALNCLTAVMTPPWTCVFAAHLLVLEHLCTPDSPVQLDAFLKMYFPPRQGCDASSRAKKDACRKGEKLSQVFTYLLQAQCCENYMSHSFTAKASYCELSVGYSLIIIWIFSCCHLARIFQCMLSDVEHWGSECLPS